MSLFLTTVPFLSASSKVGSVAEPQLWPDAPL